MVHLNWAIKGEDKLCEHHKSKQKELKKTNKQSKKSKIEQKKLRKKNILWAQSMHFDAPFGP